MIFSGQQPSPKRSSSKKGLPANTLESDMLNRAVAEVQNLNKQLENMWGGFGNVGKPRAKSYAFSGGNNGF